MGKELRVTPLQAETGSTGYVTLFGKITGSDTDDTATITGNGFASVACVSSTGVYTVTMDGDYDMDNLVGVSFVFSAADPTAIDTFEAYLDEDGTTDQTLLFNIMEAGTAGDLEAAEYLYVAVTVAVSGLALKRPRS